MAHRNSDESLRDLGRRWQATKDRSDALVYLRAMARTGALTDLEIARLNFLYPAGPRPEDAPEIQDADFVDVDEIAQDLNDGFEKFVSWDQIYERLQRDSRKETIEDACFSWAEQALEYNAPDTIADFQKTHGVRLTSEQRDQVSLLWESILQDACREAFLVDLRRVVKSAVKLVNDASEYEGECDLEPRGLPVPSAISGSRRLAVRSWREGEDADGEYGVWFTLSRTFIRAYAEAGFCAANYHVQAASAHPDEFCMKRYDGDDVILAAKWWGDCIGDKLAFPRNQEDPSYHIKYPKDEQVMTAVLEAGPLKKARRRNASDTQIRDLERKVLAGGGTNEDRERLCSMWSRAARAAKPPEPQKAPVRDEKAEGGWSQVLKFDGRDWLKNNWRDLGSPNSIGGSDLEDGSIEILEHEAGVFEDIRRVVFLEPPTYRFYADLTGEEWWSYYVRIEGVAHAADEDES